MVVLKYVISFPHTISANRYHSPLLYHLGSRRDGHRRLLRRTHFQHPGRPGRVSAVRHDEILPGTVLFHPGHLFYSLAGLLVRLLALHGGHCELSQLQD